MFDWINSRLSIEARLGLIAVLFLMPIALLTSLFVVQALGDIAFAGKEIDGSHYLTEIWPGFIKTALSGALPSESWPDQARFDADFGSGDAASAYAKAGDAATRLAAGKALIGAVADGSNLTLDPDLDSFYAMDAATVRLPGIVVAAHAIGAAAAAPAGSPGRLAHIAVAVDRLQISADDAEGSLAASMKANPLTAATLASDANALKAAVEGLAGEGRLLLDDHPAQQIDAKTQALLHQVDATFVTTH
jgi:methyl-accepting chemotaxis protein